MLFFYYNYMYNMYFFSLKFKCFIVLKEYIFTIYLK